MATSRKRSARLWLAVLVGIVAALTLYGCPSRNQQQPAPTGGGTIASGGGEETLNAVQHNNLGVLKIEQYVVDAPDKGVKGPIYEFEAASKLDPNNPTIWTNLGIAYYSTMNRFPDAKNALEKAIQLGSTLPNTYYTLGLVQLKLMDYPGAEASFRKTLTIDDRDAFTYNGLGDALREQNKWPEAVDAYYKALKYNPLFWTARNSLQLLLRRMGKSAEADKVIAAKPKLAPIMFEKDYLGWGKYAECLPIRGDAKNRTESQAANVHFTEVSAQAGLGPQATLTHAGLESPRGDASGAAWNDYDSDGKPDAAVLTNGGMGPMVRLYHNEGNGKFSDVTGQSGIRYSGVPVGLCWGDYDSDTKPNRKYPQEVYPDLLVYGSAGLRLYHNDGDGKFSDKTDQAGLQGAGKPLGFACFVDANHDGQLDIFASEQNGPNHLYIGDGNGHFQENTGAGVGVKPTAHTFALPTDYDQNRAIDFLVLSAKGENAMLRNDYDGTFSDHIQETGLDKLGPAFCAESADFNNDSQLDLAIGTDKGVVVAVHDGVAHYATTLLPLPAGVSGIVTSLQVADFDGDGNYDILAAVQPKPNASPTSGSTGRLVLYHGTGDGTFTEVTASAGLDKIAVPYRAHLCLADFDGNGFADVLVAGGNGVRLLQNGGSRNHWIGVQLIGNADIVSNKYRQIDNANAIGAWVEVWAGNVWEKTEYTPGSGNDPMLLFGLGSNSKPDWVRIQWPSGARQPENDLPASPGDQKNRVALQSGQQIRLAEYARKIVSCPILYVWNGKEYKFVTDLEGGAIVGYQVAPGQYDVPDTAEHVALPGELFGLRDGKLSIEIADQLEEVLFIDAAHLIAVDHPADTTIFSNHKLYANPPYPPYKTLAVDALRPIKSATDNTGADVTAQLARMDRKYPDHFRLLRFQGYAEPHTLTIDLGDTGHAKQVLLLLYGWTDYADSSANVAAARVGITSQSPKLEVKDAQGHWKTAIADMGSVAGLPKWMAVDLTGKFLSQDRHVRITTNMPLYWDCARVGLRNRDIPLRLTRMKPAKAEYHYLGYPDPVYPDGRYPMVYDYAHRHELAPYMTLTGDYTRPGDVTELMQAADDRYVIMHHGHAIRLEFDPSRLPALPKGWKRDYVLYSDGFGKDMDMNSAYNHTVEPLPFHKMSKYPYDPRKERYPEDIAHLDYRLKYNTWHVGPGEARGRAVYWGEQMRPRR